MCDTTDPCCPLADQYTRNFYDYCTSDVERKLSPQINTRAIEEVEGDVQCLTALALETMSSQTMISSGANAINNIACSFGQDSIDLLQKQLLDYYSGCRSSIVGAFDMGLPFLWLPLVLRSFIAKQSAFSVPFIATFFLSLFLVFRATLLTGLARGTVVPSSTSEFALTDIAVWCEFAAVCLLGLVITLATTTSKRLHSSKGFSSSKSQQGFFFLMMFLLLGVYIAFVIGCSQVGDSSSGVTNPKTNCEGRVPVEMSMWTTRRILRFTYECLLAAMGLLIGVWLVWVSWLISQKTKGSDTVQLFRLTCSTAMLAIMILSHAIIAMILIGTEYNNFIFGIVMLYITELVPVFAFFVLSLWNNITEVATASFSIPRSPRAVVAESIESGSK